MSATAPEARRFQGTVLGYITPWYAITTMHPTTIQTLHWHYTVTNASYRLACTQEAVGTPALAKNAHRLGAARVLACMYGHEHA